MGPFEGAQRPRSVLSYEEPLWGRGLSGVVGLDEVGRGPLAGPVVAAAVLLPRGASVPGVTDSKTLAPGRRETLSRAILGTALAIGVGGASVREIDRLNILRATTLAMNRALGALERHPACPGIDHLVVDGLPVRGLEWEHEAVVKGDAKVHSIACASIVAKVVRDRLMARLAPRYPRYGWGTNMGYGTREHRDALRVHGPTPHHRLSFAGVQLDLDL